MVEEIKPNVSPSGSIKGYSVKTWFIKTKNTFKPFVMAIVAIAVFTIPTIKSPELSVAVAAGAAAGSKWLMDLLDFWLSDVELKP